MLLFLDTETTGLDHDTLQPLEVAAILTDDKLVELARFHRVLVFPRTGPAIDPVVVTMHTLSGLWLESMRADLTAAMADADLYAWVCSHHAPSTSSLRTSKIVLAGNSVHYDREVLRRHFPRTFSLLHYRQIDLTSLNEMAWRFSPSVLDVYQRGAPAHRALPDALESLELARYYAKVLGSHAAPLVVLEDAAPKP